MFKLRRSVAPRVLLGGLRGLRPRLNSIRGIYYEIMKKKHYRQFNRKFIVSGNVFEFYEYENPVVKGFETQKKGRANQGITTQETKEENRKKIAYRARNTVRRTANANPQLRKFVTLTFAENMTDIKKARYEFDKFIKRLKSRFRYLQYICVIEFQKRGAIHFHLLCNLLYIPAEKLAQIWSLGFVKINHIDNVDNVGAYITKYMSKDNIDERLIGKKCYTMSKGLKAPQEITDEREIDELLATMENVKRTYTAEFESDYYGKVKYTQIIICRPEPTEKARRPERPRIPERPPKIPCPV